MRSSVILLVALTATVVVASPFHLDIIFKGLSDGAMKGLNPIAYNYSCLVNILDDAATREASVKGVWDNTKPTLLRLMDSEECKDIQPIDKQEKCQFRLILKITIKTFTFFNKLSWRNNRLSYELKEKIYDQCEPDYSAEVEQILQSLQEESNVTEN